MNDLISKFGIKLKVVTVHSTQRAQSSAHRVGTMGILRASLLLLSLLLLSGTSSGKPSPRPHRPQSCSEVDCGEDRVCIEEGRQAKCAVPCEEPERPCSEDEVCLQEVTPRGNRLGKEECKALSLIEVGQTSGTGSGSGSKPVVQDEVEEEEEEEEEEETSPTSYNCTDFLQALAALNTSHSVCLDSAEVVASFLKLKKKESDECVTACDDLHSPPQAPSDPDTRPSPHGPPHPSTPRAHTPRRTHRFSCSDLLHLESSEFFSGTEPCVEAVGELGLMKKEEEECEMACLELN